MNPFVQPAQPLIPPAVSSLVSRIPVQNNPPLPVSSSSASLLAQVVQPQQQQPMVLLTTQPSLGYTTPYVTTTNGSVIIGPVPGLSYPYGTTVIGTSSNAFGYGVPLGQTIIGANNRYYDGSGIDKNPNARYETAKEMRYKFLDTWLFDDYPKIIRKLIVQNGGVRVASAEEEKKNDVNSNSEKDLEAISDFIGDEILTINKTLKVLDRFITKNGIKFYDIPHNEKYVKKSLARHVEKKIKEMQK